MIKLDATKSMLKVISLELLTSNSVNANRVEFSFNSDWDGMIKTAVFKVGSTSVSVLLSDDSCTVPWEVLQNANLNVEVGVYGTLGDAVVLPTIWANLGAVKDGAKPGESGKEPAPDIYAQILKAFPPGGTTGQVLAKASEADRDVHWVDQTGGGGAGGTTDHNDLSNRNAADQHPISAITGLEKALNDKQPVGNYLIDESDPTVPAWAKAEQKPEYTAEEIGADPSGTAAGLVSAHNTAGAAHSDIRLLITGLTQRLNALADSDDTTLDQLSEIVAYIKSNRDLISSITTDKVGVADIVNDLVTNITTKPLSAAQGVALKALIDAITIPEKLPNPNALTFTGAVEGSYDGSAPLEVNIPSGGGTEGLSALGWKTYQTIIVEEENVSSVEFTDFDIDFKECGILQKAIAGTTIGLLYRINDMKLADNFFSDFHVATRYNEIFFTRYGIDGAYCVEITDNRTTPGAKSLISKAIRNTTIPVQTITSVKVQARSANQYFIVGDEFTLIYR